MGEPSAGGHNSSGPHLASRSGRSSHVRDRFLSSAALGGTDSSRRLMDSRSGSRSVRQGHYEEYPDDEATIGSFNAEHSCVEMQGVSDGPTNISRSGRGSRFFTRVGSFVSGLYGYGNVSKRKSGRKSGDSTQVMARCPECRAPVDIGGGCHSCDNAEYEVDGRVPPLLPPSISSSFQPFCMLRPSVTDEKGNVKASKPKSFVLDPRGTRMKIWTRFFFVTVGLSLFTDPCYLYTFSFTTSSCLYIQGTFAMVITGLAAMCFIAYAVQTYLSFKTAYVSKESLVLGRGELVFDSRTIARHHLFSPSGFLLDVLVLLPIPQILLFVVTPLVFTSVFYSQPDISSVLGLGFLVVLVQYVVKVLHTVLVAARAQRVNGYVFGTMWWGFVLNFTVFMIIAHALGGLWYVETVSSAFECLQQQCTVGCDYSYLVCQNVISFGSPSSRDEADAIWGEPGGNASTACFTTNSWNYGIYTDAVQLLQEASPAEKIMYGIFYGMMTMATFGNALVPAPDFDQAIFSFVFVICGLLLFTTLIGNIGVFLSNVTAHMDEMRMRRKNMDWWMRRRQLPDELQARVRQQERLDFVATRGMDEGTLLHDLPISLKRQVKRHLCGQLVRGVPLFHTLDDLVVDNICVRLKPCVLIYGMEIVQQGNPVQEMLFILKGTIRCTHTMPSGAKSMWDMGPGSFCGEELLFWSLSPERDSSLLPSAHATMRADSVLEMFSLSAADLKFITSHFKSQLRGKKLRWLIKYYSPHWRTWAAVTIQLWWRRKKRRSAMAWPGQPFDSGATYTSLYFVAKPEDSMNRGDESKGPQ